eukprot:6207907-Pleurochrysis_carterae.AAC.1
MSARTPEIIGVDMLVPERTRYSFAGPTVPVFSMTVERMLTPGAAMSIQSPKLLKSARSNALFTAESKVAPHNIAVGRRKLGRGCRYDNGYLQAMGRRKKVQLQERSPFATG